EFFTKKMQEEFDAHPELQELENGGSKAESIAPSGNGESTPQPTGTRIKIISSSIRNNEAAANGVKPVAHSDGE
ncbi:hypothetical protein E4U21_003026, partial [Claviceps maximensis]